MRLAVKIGLGLLVLLGAVYLFVLPARTYLAQKHDITLQEQTISALRTENSKLTAQRSALQDDAVIERIARQQYGLVLPGQEEFMVVPSPGPALAAAPPAPRPAPWYAPLEFWHHL